MVVGEICTRYCESTIVSEKWVVVCVLDLVPLWVCEIKNKQKQKNKNKKQYTFFFFFFFFLVLLTMCVCGVGRGRRGGGKSPT